MIDDDIPVLTDKVKPTLVERVETITWPQIVMGLLALALAIGFLSVSALYFRDAVAYERVLYKQKAQINELLTFQADAQVKLKTLEDARERLILCGLTGAIELCPELRVPPPADEPVPAHEAGLVVETLSAGQDETEGDAEDAEAGDTRAAYVTSPAELRAVDDEANLGILEHPSIIVENIRVTG